ncbi:MAG: OadG family protein [candidate division Zixibacteria bacterium]|nr:OadG family protein [candidate division Zixibacteria bacterium]
MSESVKFSLDFAVIGISIVFVSLAIISFAIWLIRKADDGWQLHEANKKEEALEKEQNIDTTTLIIISAAVATMALGRFHIRKVRRLMKGDSQHRPWSVQGRAVLHGSHITGNRKRQR